MILYVNGDSNSVGITGSFWVNRVRSHYGAELMNQSMGGGSNPRILRTTKDFFARPHADLTDYFVIIGWTSWEREEWFFENRWFQVNAGGTDSLPPTLRDRYKQWISDSDSISQINKSRSLHNEIFGLHEFFDRLNVRHLFFNALMPFQHEVLSQPSLRLDWNDRYIGPYDNDWAYFWFLQKHGFTPDCHNHHSQEAQDMWGDTIIRYIESKKLLS